MAYTVPFFNNYDFQNLITRGTEFSGFLYHYTSVGTLLKILKSKQLRFSNRLYLNDYSEGRYVLDICSENIDDIWPEQSSYSKDKFKDALSALKRNITIGKFSIYQLSLSRDSDSLSMWNYYAKGDGINIQLSSSKLIESFGTQYSTEARWPVGFMHGSVIYDKQEQLKILKQLLLDFSKTVPMIDEWYLYTSWAVLHVGTFFKNRSFREEQEYRISFNPAFDFEDQEKCLTIKSTKREEPYRVDVYQNGNMLVPYIDIDFDEEVVEGITLSPRTEINSIESGLRIALHMSGFDTRKVIIGKSEIPVRF